MKEVLRINKKEENDKPVEFTHYWNDTKKRWIEGVTEPDDFDNVLYRETIDGVDYFVCWNNGLELSLNYKGHLNSGKY